MRLIEGFRLRHIMGQATIIGEGTAQVNFNKLITLNDSAAYLWEAVEGKDFDVQMLADLLVERYGIDSELASRDAEVISSKWIEIGLAE